MGGGGGGGAVGMETTSWTCSEDADGRLACKPANHSAHIHERQGSSASGLQCRSFFSCQQWSWRHFMLPCLLCRQPEEGVFGGALVRAGAHPTPMSCAASMGANISAVNLELFYVTDPAAVNACCPSPHWCLHRRSGHATYARHEPPTAHVCTLYQNQSPNSTCSTLPVAPGPACDLRLRRQQWRRVPARLTAGRAPRLMRQLGRQFRKLGHPGADVARLRRTHAAVLHSPLVEMDRARHACDEQQERRHPICSRPSCPLWQVLNSHAYVNSRVKLTQATW